jgi:transcription elongation factor GreB
MSRAFVKESDEDLAADELPERPLGAHANYVTARGLAMLRDRLKALESERERLAAADDPMAKQNLLEAKRDIRYCRAQIDRAIVVERTGQPRDEVHFGATVAILGGDNIRHEFHIVGDDEAEVAFGRISWASPLAAAMMGAKVGDTVKWQRPAGVTEVEIIAIHYDTKV